MKRTTLATLAALALLSSTGCTVLHIADRVANGWHCLPATAKEGDRLPSNKPDAYGLIVKVTGPDATACPRAGFPVRGTVREEFEVDGKPRDPSVPR